MQHRLPDIGALIVVGIDQYKPTVAPVTCGRRHQIDADAAPYRFRSGERKRRAKFTAGTLQFESIEQITQAG
jgi:hypothetical protein